jgi:hypothetical protein
MIRWFIIFAILLVVLMDAASAADGNRVEFEPRRQGDPEWIIGRVIYFNGMTDPFPGYNTQERHVTVPGYGDIVYLIESTYNYPVPGGVPDILTVVRVPDGVGVTPAEITAPEQATTSLIVYDPELFPQG